MNEVNTVERPVMQFKMVHSYFPDESQRFTEATAPDWLTGTNTRAGSTMDSRGFWVKHCLTLQIGNLPAGAWREQ